MKQIYICHDRRIGILSAIYDAWKECRDKEAGIELRGMTEQQLFCEYVEVEESEKKAAAVERLIREHLGQEAYENVCYALLSEDRMKADAVFHVMQAARKIACSTKIMDYLGNPHVAKVFELKRNVANEAHSFIEFIRFRELENGVMFSEIAPKNRVLTCIADHFANRFPLENWMIYDKVHLEFLVHRTKCHWILVEGQELNREIADRVSKEEKEYEKLWKGFFHAIAIEERANLRLQRSHMPFRYRNDVVEFQ